MCVILRYCRDVCSKVGFGDYRVVLGFSYRDVVFFRIDSFGLRVVTFVVISVFSWGFLFFVVWVVIIFNFY